MTGINSNPKAVPWVGLDTSPHQIRGEKWNNKLLILQHVRQTFPRRTVRDPAGGPSLLISTFQHLPGFSARKERDLWNAGTLTWSDFIGSFSQPDLFGIDAFPILKQSLSAWQARDITFFADNLPRQLHYRLALAFPEECIFLDIETTGLSYYYHEITLIGWQWRDNYSVFVVGRDAHDLISNLSTAKIIITFNGTLFDIPFLRRSFPTIRFPHVHIDLRFLARRVGLRGGQKSIEQEIGFLRPSIVQGQEGDQAPVLWQRFRRGNADALRQLVAYNLADIDGMKAILDEIVARLQVTGELPASVPVPRFSASSTDARSDQIFRSITLPRPPVSGTAISYSSLFPQPRRRSIRVLGVDLVAAETRASGWALLRDSTVVTGQVRSDTDVMELLERTRPDLVSIDAPLSLPKGRVSVEDSDPGRHHFGITRACERILFRRGIRVYPALIRSMQGLTRRGMGLAQALRARGIPVIESFPGAAQDILQIPRKREGLDLLKQGIKDFGIEGDFTRPEVTHDEIDAITSALVGVFFWENRYEALGNETEDFLIVPDLKVSPPKQVVVGVSGAIAAGKTTVSRYIEARGFFYIRFSQVIDQLITEKGLPLDRVHRQLVGEQVNRSPGQRWLCQELLRLVPQDVSHIVVDGLRFPEDHAFLSERFGSRFTHVHIVAGEDIRQARYAAAGLAAQEFFSAEHAWTEKHHGVLASLAHYAVINESDLQALRLSIDKILADYLSVEVSPWQ